MRRAQIGSLAAVIAPLMPFVMAACGGTGDTQGTGGNATHSTGTGTGTGGGMGGSGASGSNSSSGQTGGGGNAQSCTPNESVSCYSGPFGTDGVGDCKAGTKTCNAEGTGFGPCTGEVVPQDETCLTPGDEDCDGNFNEEGAGCVCVPGALKLCYSGPDGTAGVGACIEGVQTCDVDGLGYGPCMGEVTPQPEDCSTIGVDEDCDGQTPLCPATWAARYGDASNQFIWGLAVDGMGNTAITGDIEGAMTNFGGGALASAGLSDIFVAKFDMNGGHLWSKKFGDAALQSGQGVAAGPNGEVVIVGYFQGAVNFGGGALTTSGGADIFLAKFDAAGAHVWSKKLGSATDDQIGLAVAIDTAGDVIITGSYQGAINFGGASLTSAGGADVFVAKYASATGAHVWSKRFGDAALDQIGQAITTDASNNVIVTGHFNGSIDFGGGALATAGGTDVFLAKFDSAGNHVFSARYGGSGYDNGRGVAADAAGNIFVVGDYVSSIDLGGGALVSAGGTDLFIGRFDPMGAYLNGARYGGFGNDAANAVAVNGNALVITGHWESDAPFGPSALATAGGRDVLLAKLSAADLSVTWARLFGDMAFYQAGQGAGVSATGDVTVGGYFFGTVDFGAGPLVSAGGADVFIAKLPP